MVYVGPIQNGWLNFILQNCNLCNVKFLSKELGLWNWDVELYDGYTSGNMNMYLNGNRLNVFENLSFYCKIANFGINLVFVL